MKILAFDKDFEYIERFGYFLEKYSAEMQILNFESIEKLVEYAEEREYDMLLCCTLTNDEDKRTLSKINMHIPFAWLSSKNEEVNGQNTIFKYQNIVNIYNQICIFYESVYQHKINRKNKFGLQESSERKTKIVTFFPVHGGAGSSVMAIACAQNFSQDKNVLYLNLEQFSTDNYFQSNKSKDFSDIIAEVKGKYTEESLKKMIRLCICNDENINSRNLFFIKSCKNAMDMSIIGKKIMNELLDILKKDNFYDYIVIDASMVISDITEALIESSDKIVFTTDASNDANQKMKKIKRYVQIVERNQEHQASQYMIYNKFYADAELYEYTHGMIVIGNFGRFRLNDNQQIKRQTVVKNICITPNLFEKLI